jgi:hypothetical protein
MSSFVPPQVRDLRSAKGTTQFDVVADEYDVK